MHCIPCNVFYAFALYSLHYMHCILCIVTLKLVTTNPSVTGGEGGKRLPYRAAIVAKKLFRVTKLGTRMKVAGVPNISYNHNVDDYMMH